MEGAPKSNKPKVEKVEKTPESEQFIGHHYIEDVVAHTQALQESCITDPNSPECTTESIHSEIENSDVGGVFDDYEHHRMISIDDLSDSIVVLVSRLDEELKDSVWDEEDREFLTKQMNLLKERDTEIRSAIRRYVSTLSRFFILKKQRDRLEPEEFAQKMGDIDKRRRVAHDSLISSLNLYTRIVSELKEEGILDNVTINTWGPGEDFSLVDISDSVSVFNSSFLGNRDLIKDWAISAHLFDSLRKIDELQKDDVAE